MELLNPFDSLTKLAKESPQMEALITPSQTLGWQELYETSRALAFWFRRAGLKKGDLVALDVPISIRPVATLALLHEAATVCPSTPNTEVLAEISCKFIVTTDAAKQAPGITRLHLDTSAFLVGSDYDLSQFTPVEYQAEDLCKVSFSSGSSGSPKAIGISFGAISFRVLNRVATLQAGHNHVMTLGPDAMFNELLASLASKKPLIVAESIGQAIELAFRLGSESIQASPSQVTDLLRQLDRLHKSEITIKRLFVTGASLPDGLVEKLRTKYGIATYSRFGVTETGVIAESEIVPRSERELGEPFPSVEVAVLSEMGTRVTTDEIGLLAIRTPGVATMYLGAKEAPCTSPDGFFRTQDRAMKMPDGRVLLLGRADTVLNAGGVKVLPELLDEYCLEHLGIEAAAFLARDDSGQERLGLAFVATQEF